MLANAPGYDYNALSSEGSFCIYLVAILTQDCTFFCCHSSKRRKEYLVLTCGPPSLSTTTPEGKGEDGESCSDEDSSEDDENQTVSNSRALN